MGKYKIVLLCLSWYIVSASNNVVGKWVLRDWPHPLTLSFIQVVSQTVYLGSLLKFWHVDSLPYVVYKSYWSKILPLAANKILGALLSHVAIWKVSVSYAHTVKALMPFFTVIMAKLVLGATYTVKEYLSLLPIVGGVMLATATEIEFDIIGLISCVLSTLSFALQNVYSKKVLSDVKVHHLRLLHTMSRSATSLMLPIWFVFDVMPILEEKDTVRYPYYPYWITFLVFLNGFINFLQNIIAFTILWTINPLSYSVASATKRIFVIVISIAILRNPITSANAIGMTLAAGGVVIYNRVSSANFMN
ncbi:uncharacterized protein TRIADDRAFT_28036 [Trichoplax adhaerens]|uniref:Solute carrier family 35 member E1-like protein n=1 Tax=Trichoplax adhaerens TaxID=10228 RepID=B3S122_TRIAD|nr:hypothetical protein TRIADDRAFT_28036 [Trichoplax adhaerens]EDV23491.1 hypothetical protein TRIADDRAFT_28036 [Trichoplax adhaerens]FAA00711.1 TPA: solute carrier family 35 member E1-like protein [Trichoplax adhaerens]|eukprot:XP_002114401.1 hypothetical protein TRIADDRAFT_28036 [Trichoplax adhaerens]